LRLRRSCCYLNNDPLGRRSSVHERPEQSPELLNDLARDVKKKGQGSPGNPFWLRGERIDSDVRVADEVRMPGRLYESRMSKSV
jgi:hypothetical protein